MKARLTVSLGPPGASRDVVAFGENSLDFVAELGPGAHAGSKRTLNSFALRIGGQMATAAVAAAQLGLRSTYIGAFGEDDWGKEVREELEQKGVDVRPILRKGTPSRIAIVLIDESGDRQVLEHRHKGLLILPWEVPAADCVAGRLLLVDATNPQASLEAARTARRHGIPTVVDADRVSPETEALLSAIDVIIVPEPFVIEWAGVYDLDSGLSQMASAFPSAAAIVATRGPQGSLCLADGQWIETPGFEVPVLDTTGAGDAFRAGFAAGWLREGNQPDLTAVLRFANATAALNCRAVGAQAGLPAETEVLGLCNGSRE